MNSRLPRIGLYQPYPHTFGGVQTVVLQLARTLPQHDYQPVIISPEEGKFVATAREQEHACFVSDPGPEWHVYGRGAKCLSYLLSFKRIWGLVRYWFKLARDLRRHQIDLLHCNDYRGVMLAAPAARLARVPVLWHQHGVVSSRLANLAAAALVQWTVPVSRGMLDYLKMPRSWLGRYEVIHNGIDDLGDDEELRMPAPAVTAKVPADGTSSCDECPVILAMGALHPRKGYETLLHAFKRVAARISNVECWIAGGDFGDGSHGKQLRALSEKLGLAGRIKFLGHSSDVRALMQRCTLLAVPSRVEVFGLVVLEAMRAGKPIVACRTGGLPEIIEHRKTGVLVIPADAAQMAMACVEILGNRALAETMGRAGRKRVREEFSLEKMTAAFSDLYRRLLTRARRASSSWLTAAVRKQLWWRRTAPAPASTALPGEP